MKKTAVPKLRFPEFENSPGWPQRNFSEVLTEHGTKSEGTEKVYSVSVHKGVVDQIKHLGRSFSAANTSNYKKVFTGDIIYTKSPTGDFPLGIIKQSKVEMPVIVSPLYGVFTPETFALGYILDSYFESPVNVNNYLSSIVQKGAKNTINISNKTFLSKSLYLPENEKEQKKLADCLSSIDNLITAQVEKVEALKAHKKGLMQQLFPAEGETMPKLRFPEFQNDGKWVEKTLGKVADNIMYGMNAAAVEYDGENKYIRITDIDENTREFSPNPLTSPNGLLEEKYLVKIGDLLFARTGASVGKSYLHQKENGKIYFAGFLIRLSIINAVPYFIYAQTLTEKYQKWVLKTSMRSGQPGINAEEYKSCPMYLPPRIQEQQKIAEFLYSIDERIISQVEKLKSLKDHKKGLMQQLFPKIEE